MKFPLAFPDDPAPSEGFPAPVPVPFWKVVLDLVLLTLVLPIVVPVMLVAAAWISMVSPGSVFFIQDRVGRGGRLFRCYKLRTMHAGCPSTAHERHLQQLLQDDRPMNKLDTADSRLIPGARVLRALGVDELPQLINVLRGEMSIIGPRPCIPYEAQKYQPWQRERFAGLPGMTGLWQVRGKNGTTFQEMIRLDIEYVRSHTLWLDLCILLATPKAILLQVANACWSRVTPAQRRLSPTGPVPIATTDGSGVVG
jgi:lipopolysaccharide/colanic/teichoic acid biosynthesis glycosyltransferase